MKAMITRSARWDWRQVARPLLAVILATVIILAIMLTGMQRGMHHKVSFGPESEQASIAVALSDVVYRLNLGYVAHASVLNKLKEIWNRGAKGTHDEILIANSSDSQLMNEAIRAAASLGPQRVGYIGDGTLVTMFYADLGQVDFDKLGFRLFGLNIESRYYLYFSLLSLSALVFVMTFHTRLNALVVLLCSLLSLYIELYLAMFSPYVPTFSGMRHGSTLGLIPMWYFIFLLGQKPTAGNVLGSVIQLSILILAWRIRGSVAWMFIFILTTALVTAALGGPRRLAPLDWLAHLRRKLTVWPIILLIGISLQMVYLRTAPHPAYARDDFLPMHFIWHSAYLGFKFSPELMAPRVKKGFEKVGGNDTLGWYAALDYADRIRLMPWTDIDSPPPIGSISPWSNNYKPRMHDDLMRGAVIEAVTKRPLATLKLYLYRKPIAILEVLKSTMSDAPTYTWLWLMLGGGMMVLTLLLTLGEALDLAQLARLVLLVGAAIPFAAIPNIWAYPGPHASIDMVVSFAAFVPLALGLGAMAMWRMLSSLHAVAE